MRCCIFLALLGTSLFSLAENRVAVSIIIDDIGHNYKRGNKAITLPGSFTYAILPETRYASKLAEKAHLLNKEVMVHLPMESISAYPLSPDIEKGLTHALTKKDFIGRINKLFDSIPHAQGANNHQGSYLTQQYKEMHWLMDEVNRRKMYFVDSRTTHQTVASTVASVRNIFSATRDVFLDVDRNESFIDKSFNRLIRIAKKKGTAIAIGHPYKVTLRYLKTAEKKLNGKGIDLIPVSNLIALQKINALLVAESNAAQGKMAAEPVAAD